MHPKLFAPILYLVVEVVNVFWQTFLYFTDPIGLFQFYIGRVKLLSEYIFCFTLNLFGRKTMGPDGWGKRTKHHCRYE